jgi:hypothetical protein
MDRERAYEVNAAMVRVQMFSMGLEEICPDVSVYSLAEMVQAARVIKAIEDAETSPDGSQTITVTCDDRLVAAIYAMTHHDGEPNGNPKPILVAHGKALVCVDVSKLKGTR